MASSSRQNAIIRFARASVRGETPPELIPMTPEARIQMQLEIRSALDKGDITFRESVDAMLNVIENDPDEELLDPDINYGYTCRDPKMPVLTSPVAVAVAPPAPAAIRTNLHLVSLRQSLGVRVKSTSTTTNASLSHTKPFTSTSSGSRSLFKVKTNTCESKKRPVTLSLPKSLNKHKVFRARLPFWQKTASKPATSPDITSFSSSIIKSGTITSTKPYRDRDKTYTRPALSPDITSFGSAISTSTVRPKQPKPWRKKSAKASLSTHYARSVSSSSKIKSGSVKTTIASSSPLTTSNILVKETHTGSTGVSSVPKDAIASSATSSPSQNSRNLSAATFQIGEKVICYEPQNKATKSKEDSSHSTEGLGLLYNCQILNIIYPDDHSDSQYIVEFQVGKFRWVRAVPEQLILKFDETSINLQTDILKTIASSSNIKNFHLGTLAGNIISSYLKGQFSNMQEC